MRLCFLFLFFPLFISAQEVPIGQWKDYLSYHNPQYLIEIENVLYCVTEEGLFLFDKQTGHISRMSKITGLSDVNVSRIGYSKNNNTIIIIYENTNIDLIKNGNIFNVSDIKRAEISGLKKINALIIDDELAYLSCSFGIVVLDIKNIEIKDTYYINSAGGDNSVNQIAILNDSIYVASNNGIYSSSIYNAFLSDYNQWEKHNSFLNPTHVNKKFKNLVVFNGQLVAQMDQTVDSFFVYQSSLWNYIENINYKINPKMIVSKNRFLLIDSTDVFIYKDQFLLEDSLIGFSDVEHVIKDSLGVFWIADKNSGLLNYKGINNIDTILPNSPISTNVHSLDFLEDKLYVTHGGYSNFSALRNKSGVSIMGDFNIWSGYNYEDLNNTYDIVCCAIKDGKEYFGSWNGGLLVFENQHYLNSFNFHNTNQKLDTINWRTATNQIRISNLKKDRFGNLWGLNSEVERPLFVLTHNNVWESFNLQLDPKKLYFTDFLIDDLNQKWGVIDKKSSQAGIFVYNDNETILNPSDDQYKLLNTNVGNGGLPTTSIKCIAKDLNGEIWVGSEMGISVFYSPELVFSNYNFDSQQILIQDGDYGQYLLSSETVTCISIDGGNRKWIGTKNSGVYLLSEDGLEELLHFTEKNSPLFSNHIIDVAINPSNGEVFIATENGLLSYKGSATKAELSQNEIKIFPNPVRENYDGIIGIDGLIENANIKITDISGNLVFEGVSAGGRGTWNGFNKNGEKVGTGVYIVFTTDMLGEEKAVGKILFIK